MKTTRRDFLKGVITCLGLTALGILPELTEETPEPEETPIPQEEDFILEWQPSNEWVFSVYYANAPNGFGFSSMDEEMDFMYRPANGKELWYAWHKSSQEIAVSDDYGNTWTLYDADAVCGRCGKPIIQEDAETCWWCIGDLCYDCWETVGHCGHKGACEANDRAMRFVNAPIYGVWTEDTHIGHRQLASFAAEEMESL